MANIYGEPDIFERAGGWFKDKWDKVKNFKTEPKQATGNSMYTPGGYGVQNMKGGGGIDLNLSNAFSDLKNKVAENNKLVAQKANQGGTPDYTGPQNLDYSGQTPGGVVNETADDSMNLLNMGIKGDKTFDSSNILSSGNEFVEASDYSDTAYSPADMASIDANMAAEAKEPQFDSLMAKTMKSMNNQVGTDLGFGENVAADQNLMGQNEENGQTDLTLEDELLTKEAGEGEEEPEEGGFSKALGGIGKGLSSAGDSLIKSGGFQYGNIFGDR